MKNFKLLLIALSPLVFLACDPVEDRNTMGERIPEAEVAFSVTQESGFDNKVFLQNQTPGTIPYWEYRIGSATYTSTREKDTLVFIFPGDYWIKYKAFGRGGSSKIDSVKITVSNLCGDCITDPNLIALTNKEEGKYWRLFRVSLGPAYPDYSAAWGDVNWWSPETYNWDDSAYFDLNNAFNYVRYHNGVATPSGFVFNANEPMTGTVFEGEVNRSINILGGNQMMIRDGSNEMAPTNKTKYRIYRLDADTLVVGQGAYYTADRPSEDWGYFHWYVSVK